MHTRWSLRPFALRLRAVARALCARLWCMCPQQRAHVGPQLLAAWRWSRESPSVWPRAHPHAPRLRGRPSMRSKGG